LAGGFVAGFLDWKQLGAALAAVGGLGVIAGKACTDWLDWREQQRRAGLAHRIVKAVLYRLYTLYFTKVEEAEKHLHRVTLFVCQGTGQNKYLQIYARQGVFEDSQTTLAVDDDRQDRCEGLAGLIWFLDAPQTETLPD
jgi:hypothetical protein